MAVTIAKKEQFFKLYHSDTVSVLKTLEDNSIHAIVTDPPYGLSDPPDIAEMLRGWLSPMGRHTSKAVGGGFMGKGWDEAVPQPNLWKEVFRVLKPGGYILCFAGTRTVDLMGLSLRIAGFESVDMLAWHYGTGLPKAVGIDKMLDKDLGVKPTVVGFDKSKHRPNAAKNHQEGQVGEFGLKGEGSAIITEPTSAEGKKWKGWATGNLKPATEPILLMRKPLEGTYIENLRKWGVGCLNIDASRVPLAATGEDPRLGGKGDWSTSKTAQKIYEGGYAGERVASSDIGRFPSNLLLSHTEECGDSCHSTCPTLLAGEAARFFYQAKASGADRAKYCTTVENKHPTCKPIALMEHLVAMVTPPGGVVLDPFTGSGTTGIAALHKGFNFIGTERELEYFDISNERLYNCKNR